jgi:hypothetical protein
MIQSHVYFLMISFIAASIYPSCKSKSPQSAPSITYDVNPPEMLKDPNPIKDPVPSDDTSLQLNASNTPCVSQISTFGTVSDRSWREAFSRAVMQRICGKDPATAKPWRTATAYNPNSWVAGINLTAVTQNVPRGTAITPRHVVYTKHYGYHGQVGQTLNFLTMDNRVISRKIIEVKYLSTTFDPDVAVVRLDSDLPGSITPMKVLATSANSYAAIYSPLLRIDQESKALLVQASPSGPQAITVNAAYNPPGSAFALYYEDMISGDSSSPSILLMNSANGIMPILFALVTYSGPGQGPKIGALLTEIQAAIQGFGDSHKITTAPPPAAPIAAPSCAITATRVANTNICTLTVVGSADPVTGNPSVTPAAPVNWTRSGNTWTGNATCSTTVATTFNATLSGSGGMGRSCESSTIGPLVVLPTCTIAAKRKDQTETCDLTLVQTAGASANKVNLSPASSINWVKSGSTWTGSTTCSKNVSSTFTASLTSPDGTGPSCTSNDVPKVFTPPTCSLAATRQGYTGRCDITVVKTSGDFTGNPTLKPNAAESWTQSGETFKGAALCGANVTTTFAASLSGPAGVGPECIASVVPVADGIPFCSMTATRDANSSWCNLTVTRNRGLVTSGPVANPSNPTSWSKSGDNWTGKASCPTNTSTRFTAYLVGPGGEGPACGSLTVGPVIPPACSLSLTRAGTTSSCTFTLTRTSSAGTVDSFNLLGNTIKWDGNTPASNTITCSQTADTSLTATVTGQHGSASCLATLPKLTPPACQLSATRQGTTATCNLNLTGSGIIDSTKQPSVSPAASGSWSANNWTGTGTCATNASTSFTSTIEGPGGSKASCSSSAVAPVATAPTRSCKATATRQTRPGFCNLSVAVTGTVIGSPRVRPYPPAKWSRSGNTWNAVVSCPTNRNTSYSVNLTGPGNTYWGCSSNKVSAITN